MRGDDRIRTGGEGVADPCLTTWLRRHIKLNDPKGIRTPVTAVKGRCLNRLTMGPNFSLFCYNTIDTKSCQIISVK